MIEMPPDKRKWPLGLIPGQIVLVSTVDKDGNPNVAPKSWIQMVSFEPSILMFSGSKGNATENNILEIGNFGVNLVNSSMANAVFECIKWQGRERIERCGFEMVRSQKIDAPLVKGCRAHIECKLHDKKEVGSGLIVFGEILRVAVDEEVLNAERNRRYELLDTIFFLEGGLWGRLGEPERITTDK
jgi:flavin reductase (DIM6/NTAB) family NADH-FMN oxidoreductase RutF